MTENLLTITSTEGPLLGLSVGLRDLHAPTSALNARQQVYPTITYTVTITGAAAMASVVPYAGALAAAAALLV